MFKKSSKIIVHATSGIHPSLTKNTRTYKTLIVNENNRFETSESEFKYVFPENIGFLMHLTHDKKENESKVDYIERCTKKINDIIQSYGDNYYVFFAYGTVFSPRKDFEFNEESITNLKEKLINNRPISTKDPMVTEGHIAVYTKEGNCISHRPETDHSKNEKIDQNKVIGIDIQKSYSQNQKTSTYIAVLNKNCFKPIVFENLNKTIKPYGITANDDNFEKAEHDNCATAIQKVFLNMKNRSIMNPIQTLRTVIQETMDANNNNLTVEKKNDMMIKMEDSGLTRDLTEVSMDEQKYSKIFNEEMSMDFKKQ
ncbi:MAG: hypothetical protein LEGION0398_MBIBDBAK_01177 [Legionellaceae bacterium]